MRCIALRHIACEGLDHFAAPIQEFFDSITLLDPLDGYHSPEAMQQAREAELLVILGGPMGVYETDRYPFVAQETALARERIEQGQATLGLCLGSQIMAEAAGGRVFASGRQEIGFYPLQFTAEILQDPVLDKLASHPHDNGQDPIFFHWHGDTFELPVRARVFASSERFPNQGFIIGRHAIGLQFHPEISSRALEAWLKEYEGDLRPGPDVMTAQAMREAIARHERALSERGQTFLQAWLRELFG